MMEGGGPSIMESLEHIGVNGREEEHFQPASGMVGGNCSKTSLPDVLSADLQSLALVSLICPLLPSSLLPQDCSLTGKPLGT